jgi:hypothetical protein
LVVNRKQAEAEAELPHVGTALGSQGFGPGQGQRWKQHGRENGNDGNDHQEFDQGKCRLRFATPSGFSGKASAGI